MSAFWLAQVVSLQKKHPESTYHMTEDHGTTLFPWIQCLNTLISWTTDVKMHFGQSSVYYYVWVGKIGIASDFGNVS